MADPISVAASIIGLISFGSKLASILHTYIDNAVSARVEIVETAKELEALCLVLRRLEMVYRPTEWDADLKSVLDSCRRIFVELENVTERACVRDVGDGIAGWTRRWRRLLRVLGEAKDVGRLRGHLEAHKATLSITLLVSQCSEAASISESNERIERAIQEVRDMLQRSDGLSSISGTTYRPSNILENYLSVRESCTLNYLSEQSSPTSAVFPPDIHKCIPQTPEPPDIDDELELEELDPPLELDPDPDLPTIKKRKRISVFLHHSKRLPLLSNARIHTWKHPLHVAASNGDEKSVRTLTNPKTVNSPELHGLTPLHLAAARGHSSIVKYLISCGARVNFTPTELGDTPSPLLEASEYGHLETVIALLEAGADVEATNRTTGARSLHLAARAGSETIVEALLAKGADVETLDGDGQSPLHAGVLGGRWRVVRVLIEAGAGVEKEDGRGRTPFEAAWEMNWAVGVDILVKAGAQVRF